MISGIAAAAAALVGLIPTMGGLSVAVKAVGEALGAAFSFLLGAAIKTADAFNAVADTGATFGGSLLGMRNAAHDAGQSFESFSKGFLENSAGLTRFAGSATAGAEALSKIQKAVSGDGKGTGLERSLQLMGVSLKDQPAYLGEYLSMLSGSGVQLSNFNDNFTELAKRAVDYRKELIIARQLTGESNEEQKAKMRATAKDAQFQAKLSTMSADAAAGLTEQMNALPTYMQPLFKDLVLFGLATKDSAGLAMTMPGALAAMQEAIANPSKGAAGINAAMESRAVQIAQDVQDSAQMVIVSGQTSSDAMKQAAGAFVDARNYAQRLLKIDKIREDLANASAGIGAEDFTNNMLEFQRSTLKLQVDLETMVTDLIGSPLFTTLMDNASKMIEGFATGLQTTLEYMKTLETSAQAGGGGGSKISGETAAKLATKENLTNEDKQDIIQSYRAMENRQLMESDSFFKKFWGGMNNALRTALDPVADAFNLDAIEGNLRGFTDEDYRKAAAELANQTPGKLKPTPVTASVESGNKPKEQPAAALEKLTPTPVTPRAFGGPVSMNRPYLVGEQGPEIFSPPRSGTITPNLEIQKAAADGVSAAGKDSQTLETISTQLARHGQLLEQMIKVQSDGSQAATGYLKRISMN
jgi:hypothetical protein